MFAVSLALFLHCGLNLCPLLVARSPVAKSSFEIKFFKMPTKEKAARFLPRRVYSIAPYVYMYC